MAYANIIQSLDVVKKVYTNLPVAVPTSLIEENPRFTDVLLELTKVLSSSGSTLKLDAEVEKAKRDLSIKISKFLRSFIMYQEIENMATDYEVKGDNNPYDPATDENEFLAELSEVIHKSEVVTCMESLTKSGPILEFTSEELQAINPKPNAEFKKMLMKYSEERIFKHCKVLYQYYKPELQEDADVQLSELLELPALLEKDLEHVEKMQRELKHVQAVRDWQCTQYEKTLVEALNHLQELISKFRLQGPSELHKQMADYLVVKANALVLKIKLLHLEIMSNTYTTETIPALKKIGNNLTETYLENEKHLMDLTTTYDAYTALGGEFKALVDEYVQLKDATDNKLWALNKLNSS